MQNYQGHWLCDGCGQTFTIKEWSKRHFRHENGCPRLANPDSDFVCDCDLNYHERCRPDAIEAVTP